MTYRHFDPHIISLLHFDYPYYAEPNDGLNDEILGTIWSRSGNIKLAGSEISADAIISGTPKFGYRCLHSETSNDYITAGTNAFSMSSSGSYEVFCYVRPAASQSGNIFTLYSSSTQVLAVALTNDLKISVNVPGWDLSFSSTASLTLNTWHSLAVRFSPSQIAVIIDGTAETHTLSSRTAVSSTQCRLGGINGQIDEFMFRDSFSTSLPTQPVQAVLNVSELGGFSNIPVTLGDTTLTSSCVINSYASCVINSDKSLLTLSNISTGIFGGLQDHREIMLLNNETGDYEFRELRSVTGTSAKLAAPASISGNNLQIISVPQFTSLTIPENVTVSPLAFANNRGGVVVFRVKNNCTINGKIITLGLGRTRTDTLQLTHAKLIDTFLPGSGGGIMIFCGGTLTIPSTARLGASWDGSGKGGTPNAQAKGNPGGAGYGGAGGSDYDNGGIGGTGGVGGGGGGGNNGTGGNAGTGSTTGGRSGYTASSGGTQGITSGGNSSDASSAHTDTGGAGAGGSSGRTMPYNAAGASSGASIVIIAKTLKADMSAISTGGEGGNATSYAAGGGGTGFCYIACEA